MSKHIFYLLLQSGLAKASARYWPLSDCFATVESGPIIVSICIFKVTVSWPSNTVKQAG